MRPESNKNILITGATGLIGKNLCHALEKTHQVYKLKRLNEPDKSDAPNWNIDVQKPDRITAPDVIIHLAGENIAAKRWSNKQKQRLYNSRILGTKNLVNKILASDHKPQTFMCASAIGFYGNRGQEILDEESASGDNFSAQLARDWEQTTLPLAEHGIRVVNLRFGVVLSQEGGALKKMLLPFKCGLGGAIGNGQQKFSWVSIADVIQAIIFLINKPHISGPVNITSPNPVSNKTFTRTLAKTLKRPAFLDMPAPICRLLFAEMADELLLSSQHVVPEKLLKNGYTFRHLDLEMAFAEILS